jgi:NAD(P)-dependent dehydrogenase (short-subunit alcohol dehydrogenase family)
MILPFFLVRSCELPVKKDDDHAISPARYLERAVNAGAVGHQFRKTGPDAATGYSSNRGREIELATAYVMLADPLSSYVSGATIAVTGGKPIPIRVSDPTGRRKLLMDRPC